MQVKVVAFDAYGILFDTQSVAAATEAVFPLMVSSDGFDLAGAGAWCGRRAIERWGRYILLRPGDLDRADRFFRRFGGPAVLIARLLPVVRTVIALPAGIARMPQVPFQIDTFVGSWPWCYALACVGYLLGTRWNSDPALRGVLHRFDIVVIALGVLAFAWLVWRHLRHGRRPSHRTGLEG